MGKRQIVSHKSEALRFAKLGLRRPTQQVPRANPSMPCSGVGKCALQGSYLSPRQATLADEGPDSAHGFVAIQPIRATGKMGNDQQIRQAVGCPVNALGMAVYPEFMGQQTLGPHSLGKEP